MKKISLIFLSLFLLLFACSCQPKEVDITGSWYCSENDVLLTFYEDQSFDRKLVGFHSFYDGTYKWTIDSENMLKLSDLIGETLETLNWNEDENSDSTWHLQDTLVIAGHIYENTDGKEITEDDISPEFLETHTNYCCTVFLKENPGQRIQDLRDTLVAREEVKDVQYVSSDESWEEFKNDYFDGNADAAEGFVDDNPLINSEHLEVYTHTQDELDQIVGYLETLDFVGNVNVSDITIKNDSFI